MGREKNIADKNNISVSLVIPQISFAYSGGYYYSGGTQGNQGTAMLSWTRSRGNADKAWRMGFGTTNILVAESYARGAGFPLRCLAR